MAWEASGPGDLGRRIALRRQELGLSVEQTADRAGMAPGYLAYLESRPALPSMGALLRLAGVLQTTADSLLGGRVAVGPRQGVPAGRPRLVDLDPEECWELMRPGGVGHVVVSSSPAPEAIPVNYTVRDGAVVFHTSPGTTLARHLGEPVGFEVDRVDEATNEGWSVLVSGEAEAVSGSSRSPEDDDSPAPWAGGQRHLEIRLAVKTVTGRRILAP